MSYTKGHYNFDAANGPSNFAQQLGLQNLGITVLALSRGEGFDFFHSHREQEEVYFCLDGVCDLVIREEKTGNDARIVLGRGDIIRVAPETLRAIGNQSSDRATVLIAGACPHVYPAGFGHHDVISDVLAVEGQGKTGFTMPQGLSRELPEATETEC